MPVSNHLNVAQEHVHAGSGTVPAIPVSALSSPPPQPQPTHAARAPSPAHIVSATPVPHQMAAPCPPPSSTALMDHATAAAHPGHPQHITVDRGCQKKTRLVWTQELHMRFLFAVEKIGLRTAVPRTILQVMQVEGLTRENIASHLQKYRRLLEKKAGITGPVGSKDWPKLEAAQTAHLGHLRKQMDAATAAAVAAAPVPPDPTSSIHIDPPQASAPMDPPEGGLVSAAPPLPVTATDPAPPPVPDSTGALAPTVPSPRAPPAPPPAPSWQAAPPPAPPAVCVAPQPQPSMQPPMQQMQQPGMCPVTPQEPPIVPVPMTADSEGHTLGVPMPQPIMPPMMCVLPQMDGAPALLPMLPAMYMATYGRNTPDMLGTIPLQRHGMPGMPTPPATPPPPAPMPMYPPPPFGYQRDACGSLHYMPHAAAVPQMPMYGGCPPHAMPMAHQGMAEQPMQPMHGEHAAMQQPWQPHSGMWQMPAPVRPPPPVRSTLPPLVAEQTPSKKNTGSQSSGRSRDVGSGGAQARLSDGTGGGRGGAQSRGARPPQEPTVSGAGPSGAGVGGDWSDDAMAKSTLRIANMSLGSGREDAGLANDVQDGEMHDMELDGMGWDDLNEPGGSRRGETDDEEYVEDRENGGEDPVIASAIADIFMQSSPQKRQTRNSISANFL